MKKFFSILVVFMCILVGGIMFTACNGDDDSSGSNPPPPPAAPQPPLLGKSNFSITYDVKGDGTADYTLSWKAEYATKYDIVFDGVESTVTDAKLSLNDCSAGEVHTVTVTAIGSDNLKSDAVEVKFKATGKLDAPINVRPYTENRKTRLGWKESDDTNAYAVICEKLDQEIETGKPVGTGNYKSFFYSGNRISLDYLCTYYKNLELSSFESFRIKALPYDGEKTVFEYTANTEVIEYLLPSDASEQSVNLFAGEMSNPTNLRWDFSDFENHPSYATVKWDGANSNYSYSVMTQYPEGYYSGNNTEKGATESIVSFDYRCVTGDYTVTVQAECNELNYVGEDTEAKSSTWILSLPTPVTEVLKFHANQTTLESPKNIRVENEKLVWDEVDDAVDYRVFMQCGELELSPSQYYDDNTPWIPLQFLYECAIDRINYAGDYDVSVMAYAKDNELVGIENGVPQIHVYCDSEYSEPVTKLIRFKAIPTVQNAQIQTVDSDLVISWDELEEATSYYVGFYNNNGGGTGSNLNADTTRYNVRPSDLYGCDYIVVMAKCAYSVTVEDGITTILTSSSQIIRITD